MTTIYAIHAPRADHLEEVISTMRDLGAPTIEVIDCGDYYMALEGSHRLAAAHQLGLVPELVIREQDEIIDITRFDWFDACNWAETEYPAGEVAGEIFAPTQASPTHSERLALIPTSNNADAETDMTKFKLDVFEEFEGSDDLRAIQGGGGAGSRLVTTKRFNSLWLRKAYMAGLQRRYEGDDFTSVMYRAA